MDKKPVTILIVASYFKGNRFIEECYKEGCRLYLLTKLSLKEEAWARHCLQDVFYMTEFTSRDEVMRAVSYLARNIVFDRIIPMDDYDVELVASLREHLRIPGMGDTTARYFRDKLAMRVQARDEHIRCPRFEHVLNYGKLTQFMNEVPAPWFLKPRSEAGAVGIKKITCAQEFWDTINQLGDEQSYRLLEEYIPGSVYHVDSIVWDSQIVFSNVSRYVKPPFDIWNFGGVFCTRTLPQGFEEEPEVADMNRRLVKAMKIVRGVTHAEFIRSSKDGQVYFLEVAARVGGASIDMMVEAATGINLWQEWARLEIASARGETYTVPDRRYDSASLMVCLSRQAKPDTSAYNDPDIFWRMDKDHHVGLVIKNSSFNRITDLTKSYMERMAQDYLAVEPPKQTND
ncbi:MAG: acetyl-CoA carboxylase biotin carboxylase subunit family protein [Candidatus Bruticola sp.]